MDWEIIPFEGMGPIRFGMSPEQVSGLIGEPESEDDEDDGSLREYRSVELPIISYENGHVSEIEAFYDVKGVSFRTRDIFSGNGLETMQFLERENGGAEINVGIVLYDNIGITCGRLDEGARGDHSVTAFARGLWDESRPRFKQISFL
ncbi:hypothetical protein N7E02_07015 (plasmid) [Aliirhizobium terrae]|uniref:hypothetical protein n=1 Tax=Terrirhizobium terrae TaxID=2926709 RepID=UPI002575B940|nr:hypothetical protein [Rhizobium sp. CC-CFT758]WJH38385.1 hypothetical protein N7E02_07015 [Rhizobium sp. CC-CFT758]